MVFDEFHTKKDQFDTVNNKSPSQICLLIMHPVDGYTTNPVCYAEIWVNPYKYASQVDGGVLYFQQ